MNALPSCAQLRDLVRDWDTGTCSGGAAVILDFMMSKRCVVCMKLTSLSQTAIPFLIGTKFDTFATFPRDEQEEITKQVCQFVDSFGFLH